MDRGEKIICGLLLTMLLALVISVNFESRRNVEQCKAALEAKAELLIINKVCK